MHDGTIHRIVVPFVWSDRGLSRESDSVVGVV
jgi:hypothetical protein